MYKERNGRAAKIQRKRKGKGERERDRTECHETIIHSDLTVAFHDRNDHQRAHGL